MEKINLPPPQPARTKRIRRDIATEMTPEEQAVIDNINKEIIKEKKKKKADAVREKAALVKPKATVIDPVVWRDSDNPIVRKAHSKKIVWKPFPGVQTEFLESPEDEVVFAGGRGSGKSDCLIVDPLPYCTNKNFRGLVIRRTMPQLKELIRRAKEIYFQVYPGTKWKEQEKMFVFPSGASIDFGYADSVDDAERYRGQQYTWLGIDELTQYETPEIYNKMKGSLRTTDPTLKIYIRCTTNPTGKGRWWVKEYFIDRAPAGTTFFDEAEVPGHGKIRIAKKWFQSTVFDNPAILKNNPQYVAQLATLSPVLRKQWLEGSWDAVEGMAFPDFEPKVHVIDPFEIPKTWMRFRGCDWGYASMAVCLWLAIDWDNNIYVYREYAANGDLKDAYGLPIPRVTADKFALNILDRERGENIRYGVLDVSTWAHRGDSGPSIAEDMEAQGCRWWQSDRSEGSRKAAVMKMHQLLKEDEITGKPKIFIFNHCKQLIKCLSSLPVNENDPEDVDTKANDHAWDALMYAIMSRPDVRPPPFSPPPIVINKTFGY